MRIDTSLNPATDETELSHNAALSELAWNPKPYFNRDAFFQIHDIVPLLRHAVDLYKGSSMSSSKTVRDAAYLSLEQIGKYWNDLGELLSKAEQQHLEYEEQLKAFEEKSKNI